MHKKERRALLSVRLWDLDLDLDLVVVHETYLVSLIDLMVLRIVALG